MNDEIVFTKKNAYDCPRKKLAYNDDFYKKNSVTQQNMKTKEINSSGRLKIRIICYQYWFKYENGFPSRHEFIDGRCVDGRAQYYSIPDVPKSGMFALPICGWKVKSIKNAPKK